MAPPQQKPLSQAALPQTLDALPPAKVGLMLATRPANALAVAGWDGSAQYLDTLPLTAALRSWGDRFGVWLLEVGFAEIKLTGRLSRLRSRIP